MNKRDSNWFNYGFFAACAVCGLTARLGDTPVWAIVAAAVVAGVYGWRAIRSDARGVV